MSARHTRLSDARLSRLSDLRWMMGTGQGVNFTTSAAMIPNDPSMYRPEGLSPRIAHRVDPAAFVWSGLRTDLQTVRRTIRVIELPDDFAEPPREVDMRHWQQLAKEKRALEMACAHSADVRRWYPGWLPPEWPAHSQKHVSLFGSDRFRKFDPLPAFETRCGFIQFINR